MMVKEAAMSDRAALLRAILRTDLSSFIEQCFATLEPGAVYLDNWHVHAIAYQLTRVWRGESRRLIINVPPRSAKSICVTIAFTAWVLGHDPRRRIMVISYANELTRKHATDFRTIVESAWFRGLFPAFELVEVRDRELVTSERGNRFAGSIGGSVLGRGADLIVIDDPIKGLDAALSQAERRRVTEFYDSTLYSRLNDKVNGAIVIVMQRLHQDDLVGHVLDKEDWEVLSIPAIAPEDCDYQVGPSKVYCRRAGEVLHPDREPKAWLEAAERNLGKLNFSAQYQQNPMPAEGNAIKRQWIKSYDRQPDAFEFKIVSWDTASTLGESSDWSVGTVWGAIGQEFYLLDVVRDRLESPDLRRQILELSRRHRVDATLIEDTELGRALVQDLMRVGDLHPMLTKPRFDKLSRLLAQAARFEAGQVYLPSDAPWLATYLTELLAFPSGRNDDQVDSTSQALRYLTSRTPTAAERPLRVPRPPAIRRAARLGEEAADL
jgi:predicted phage terminase large subunit-like protein